ncbi:MAG: hypothetical protein HQM16_05170 [Deltaproteobacteria bacterium]|nr:hypothetical protein [Deltaproteobacteria bacterium]
MSLQMKKLVALLVKNNIYSIDVANAYVCKLTTEMVADLLKTLDGFTPGEVVGCMAPTQILQYD